MKLPLILILDIDQTIIGNSCTFEQEYYILNSILDDKKLLAKYNSSLDNYLKTIDFIRPHFLDFIKFMKDKYGKIEIFLYTNSTFNRLDFLQFILSKYFKFRKIYSRRESIGNNNKGILVIYDDIIKTLKLTKHKKEILENNIIFIDDRANVLLDYNEKQIVCTRYNNSYSYDLQEKLLKDYNIDILKDKKIMDHFRYYKYYDPKSDNLNRKDLFLYNIEKLIEQRTEVILNLKDKNNDFFLRLIEVIKKEKYKLFNTETIENINKLLIIDNDK